MHFCYYLNILEQSGIQKLKNEGLVFVVDNCSIHQAKIVGKWMQVNGIERENWHTAQIQIPLRTCGLG